MSNENPYRPPSERLASKPPENPAVAKWFMLGIVLILAGAVAGNEMGNPISDYAHMILSGLGASAIIVALLERYGFIKTADEDRPEI